MDPSTSEEPILSTASQPSFTGRLKLTDYMFTSSTSSPAGVRRSPRIASPQSLTTSTSGSRSHSPKKRKGTVTASPSSNVSAAVSPSPSKKRKRPPSGYAPPSTYAHLPPLPDAFAPNLLVMFVGLNPGISTARTGHAYAHPSNLFWKLLHSSGVTPRLCKAEEDRQMPELYQLGLTNIVSRPSRNGSELSKAEMDDGVETLEEKARQWRPESVCIVGKSIWESIWRVRHGKACGKNDFSYGWQSDNENMGVVKASGDEPGWPGARVFVATSTSGLAATLRPEEKERIWRQLGGWVEQRREERDNESNGAI